MVTDLQKRSIKAIVSMFETSSPVGNYAAVTVLPGDAGHLTYGFHQTTLASGGLRDLIKRYVDAPNARFANEFRMYVPRLQMIDLSLDHDEQFKSLLRRAGREDQVMQDVQEA